MKKFINIFILLLIVKLFLTLLFGEADVSPHNSSTDEYAIAALTATSMICLTWICVTIIKTMSQKEDKS